MAVALPGGGRIRVGRHLRDRALRPPARGRSRSRRAARPTEQTLLCRGCRGGRAQAGFVLESQGEILRDPKTTRKMQTLQGDPALRAAPRPAAREGHRAHQRGRVRPRPADHRGGRGRPRAVTSSRRARSRWSSRASRATGPTCSSGSCRPGECFGEMSLLTGDPASATIRARDQVRALSIVKEDFDDLLAKNPVLNSYFSKLLALRLKQTNSAAAKAFLEEIEKGVTGQLLDARGRRADPGDHRHRPHGRASITGGGELPHGVTSAARSTSIPRRPDPPRREQLGLRQRGVLLRVPPVAPGLVPLHARRASRSRAHVPQGHDRPAPRGHAPPRRAEDPRHRLSRAPRVVPASASSSRSPAGGTEVAFVDPGGEACPTGAP